MERTDVAQPLPAAVVAQQRWVLVTCILAACARNIAPPLWSYRPPTTDAFNQSWTNYGIMTGLFSLSMLAVILVSGILGDLFGRRRILLIGLFGLTFANLTCFLVPSEQWFIIIHMISLAFGAMVLPMALAVVFLTYEGDPNLRARAISVYVLFTTSVFLVSGSIGLVANQALGWRAPLFLPTVLGLIALLMALRTTKESRVRAENRANVVGHAGWALAVFSVLGSLIAWLATGIYATIGMGLAAIGVILGTGLLLWWERQTSTSIFGKTTIKRRMLIIMILFGLAMQFAFVGFIQQSRSMLLGIYSYSSVIATLSLAPLLLGMLLMTVYSNRRLVNTKVEPKALMAIGVLIGGTVCILAALLSATRYYPWLGILLAVFGGGMILATITWTTLFLTALPSEIVGVRTAINNAVFQMGGTLGGLIPNVLLVEFGLTAFDQILRAASVPEERIPAALTTVNILLDPPALDLVFTSELTAMLLAGYHAAYLVAYNRVLLVIAAVCVLNAALIYFGLLRLRKRAERAM